MTRFLLGVACGLMLTRSGVYAGDWFEEYRQKQVLEDLLQEQRSHNRDHEDQRRMDSMRRSLDPC